MASIDQSGSTNRKISDRAPIARFMETWLGAPINLLEAALQYVLVRPTRWMMRHLDSWSYKLEGTFLRKVLSNTLFPFTLIISFYIGL